MIIEGHVAGAGRQQVSLYRMDLTRNVAVDSMVTRRDGTFKFSQPALAEPTFFKLAFSPTNFITILADSTEHVVIEGDFATFSRDYRVKNSEGSLQVQELSNDLTKFRASIDSLINIFNALPQDQQDSNLPVITGAIDELVNKQRRETGEFVLENARSFASYYALFLTLSDGTPIMNVYNPEDRVFFAALATSLNIFYPQSERVRHLYDMVLQVKTEERQARMIQQLIESGTNQIPDITAVDVNGNNVSLSSLHGNVILLTFWASWDARSRQENATLARVYNRYKDRGFQIFQVGFERSRALWELAMLQDNVQWTSVTEFQYTDSPSARLYNVQQIPANYLISREGDIIGRNLFGARLEERLSEIFR